MFTVNQLKQSYNQKLGRLESKRKASTMNENERHESALLDINVRYFQAKQVLDKWFNTTEAVDVAKPDNS